MRKTWLYQVEELLVGRSDKIIEVSAVHKEITFETEEGHRYALCFDQKPEYLKQEPRGGMEYFSEIEECKEFD